MWVVCATVMGRLLAPRLLKRTSGRLNRLLSHRVNIALSGDKFIFNMFESQVLDTLRTQLLFRLVKDLVRLAGGGSLTPPPVEMWTLRKILVPEKYWSGCPPNRA